MAISVLRKVDGKHLPAFGTHDFREGLALFLTAAFAVDKKIQVVARGAIQHSRDNINFKSVFSHIKVLFYLQPSHRNEEENISKNIDK